MNHLDPELSAQSKLHWLLTREFEQLKQRNPQYSLRAFALRLGIGAGALSQIFAQKRNVSQKLAERLLASLELDPNEAQSLRDSFHQEYYVKQTAVAAKPQARTIPIENYYIVADWVCFALLRLMELEDFNWDFNWIAQRLNITEQRVSKAVQMLEQADILVKSETEEHSWIAKEVLLTSGNEMSSLALKNRQLANLRSAEECLFKYPVAMRDLSSMTLAINSEHIPTAKAMIQNFQDQLKVYFDQYPKNEVYELCVQFFPRTSLSAPVQEERHALNH